MPAARRKESMAGPDSDARFRKGLAESHRGERSAFITLNTALEAYLARNDVKGAALASAVLVISGQVAGDFRRFEEHIARLVVVRDDAFVWGDRNEELTTLTGLLAGLNYFGPDDPFLPRCVERIMALLETELDVNVKFAAGRAILYYMEPRNLRALGQRTYSLLRPYMDSPELTPNRQARWLSMWMSCSRFAKEDRQAKLAEEQLRALAEKHHVPYIKFWLASVDVDRHTRSRNIALAERGLADAESFADPSDLGELEWLDFLRTRIARMKGQGDRAVFYAARASNYSRELGEPNVNQAIYLVSEAQARLMIDDFATACSQLRQAAGMVPAQYADEVRDMAALAEAFEAVTAGRPEGRGLLAAAWGKMRERQFYDAFEADPEFGARLCALTLEHGIETEFVGRYIELRGIAPPVNAPESWPWPIRIHALGGFAVAHRGEPLTVEGKAQKKPLELLKILIALGGRGIAKEKLGDLLWPDAEPAAAATALDTAVSRLRKLLAEPAAIRIEEGKVNLDDRHVWLDVWAFDRDVEALQASLHGEVEDAVVQTIAARLLARYKGPFLGSEDPPRGSAAARARWQNRFRRSLADAGRHWERGGEWPRAIALYERVLDEDSLAEDLYRRLMHCHLERGEPADAARVYRRCREMLSIQLGIPPSAETEALFKSIYQR
jgi:LuxR family transcriptional regulator, maltose regulon positive regulatory protein